VDEPDRHRIQEVPLFSACFASDDESRLLEQTQVLHDATARHLQFGFQFGERAAVTREELVEQETTGRVGQSLEHPVVIGHEPSIGDQKITCQRSCAREISTDTCEVSSGSHSAIDAHVCESVTSAESNDQQRAAGG
jgi:hypothetical protein